MLCFSIISIDLPEKKARTFHCAKLRAMRLRLFDHLLAESKSASRQTELTHSLQTAYCRRLSIISKKLGKETPMISLSEISNSLSSALSAIAKLIAMRWSS